MGYHYKMATEQSRGPYSKPSKRELEKRRKKRSVVNARYRAKKKAERESVKNNQSSEPESSSQNGNQSNDSSQKKNNSSQEKTDTSSKTPDKGKVGKPKRHPVIRLAKGYKELATGDTTNSPATYSNIIFIMGMGLILVAAFSSGRLKQIFTNLWNPPFDASLVVANFVGLGSQFLFIFIISFISRAIPTFGRIGVVTMAGLWILWFMQNPQLIQLLNTTSQIGVIATPEISSNQPAGNTQTFQFSTSQLQKLQTAVQSFGKGQVL